MIAASPKTDNLLSRLEGVKQTGNGRWIAKCPAHRDKGPSFSVRELDDGRILIHCFAGCEVSAILSALGMSAADLFPDRLETQAYQRKAPWNPRDVLACIGFEALVVATAASSVSQGKPLSDADRSRLLLASERIQRAVELTRYD